MTSKKRLADLLDDDAHDTTAWFSTTTTYTTVTDSINELREEIMAKEILFIAPSRKYAETVVRNLQKDLTKHDITSNVKVESHTLWVFTAAVIVRINWWDPVSWKMADFAGYHALFGKKELVELVRDKFRDKVYNCPRQSLQGWIVEQHKIYSEITSTPAPRTKYIPEIKTVHFNYPATIVIWEDGTKTVVKCQQDDFYSPETGLALCIAKKALGNKSNFNNEFKKWLPVDQLEFVDKAYSSMKDLITDLFGKPQAIYTVED